MIACAPGHRFEQMDAVPMAAKLRILSGWVSFSDPMARAISTCFSCRTADFKSSRSSSNQRVTRISRSLFLASVTMVVATTAFDGIRGQRVCLGLLEG